MKGTNPGSYSACLVANMQIRKCRKRSRKIARQMQRVHDKPLADRLAVERRLLGSHAVRVAATADANDKLRSELRVGPEKVLEAAKLVRPTRYNDEPASVYFKRKGSGGWRPIWNLGLIRRATVEVLRPLLRAQLNPRPFQYDFKGIHKAIRGVKKAVSDGLIYAQRIDITNHFGSVLIDQLPHQLRIPKRIVEHSVSGKHIPMLGGSIPSLSLATTARSGLLQGSGLSPLIAFIITSRLNWLVPKGIRLFNFADDFLVMGASKDAVSAAADALCDAIRSLPGGHFTHNPLKRTPTSHVGDGFTFLGHMLWTDHGKIIVSATTANSDALLNRIIELEDRSRKKTPSGASPAKAASYGPNALGDAWVHARSWAAAFRECDDTTEDLAVIKMILEDDVSCWNLPPSFLDSYENPQASWKWNGSAHDASG
jgi:hypothetical protein